VPEPGFHPQYHGGKKEKESRRRKEIRRKRKHIP
jgi:hypothetical protein